MSDERYCLFCNSGGHYTNECHSTHGTNGPRSRELIRLCGFAEQAGTKPAEPSELTVEQKRAANVWDHVDDVLPVIELARAGHWTWMDNSRCKYIELRIDMRDGGCILKDRERNRIDPSALCKQISSHQYPPWSKVRESLSDWQLEAAAAVKPSPEPAVAEPTPLHPEERDMLAWAYSKLVYRSFDNMDDALMMDRIKLELEYP